MQEQTPLSIHPHTHFPGVKPSHTHLPSFPAFLTAFPPPVRSRHSCLGNAFPGRTNTRPNPKPPHARARSLLMPEGKARPRKLSKDKGSILRVWRAAWFPTLPSPTIPCRPPLPRTPMSHPDRPGRTTYSTHALSSAPTRPTRHPGGWERCVGHHRMFLPWRFLSLLTDGRGHINSDLANRAVGNRTCALTSSVVTSDTS